MTGFKIRFALLYCLSGFTGFQFAKAQSLQPFKPSPNELLSRYRSVLRKDTTTRNLVYKSRINAHWLNDGNFWYANTYGDSAVDYFFVKSTTGTRRKLFEKAEVAERLGSLLHTALPADSMRLTGITVDATTANISFGYKNKYYTYQTRKKTLYEIDSLPKITAYHHQFNDPPVRWWSYEIDSLSPDRQHVFSIKDNNVFIRSLAGGEPVQYTTDGSQAHPYGSLAWSPDSKYVIGYHTTPVEDSNVYYVLSSVPGTTRGQLRSHPYKQPGDPFTTYEMFLFQVQSKTPVKVNTPIIDFFDAPFLHWAKDNSHFYYEKVDRGHQRFRIIEVTVADGSTRTILDDQSKTFIYTDRIFTYYLPGTDEILYTSEKDNWRHIYLVDAKAGTIKAEITKGNYVVKNIDSIDEKKREIWFSANGMNADEDPYYVHYYRIGFDGNNLVNLTPEHADHHITFSPDKKYYLDNYSTVNKAPVTELHNTATGKKITVLEQADISRFLSVVKRLPEPFAAKGRDGVTDIYGIVYFPADFDSTKLYPIVENIYAGPQDAYVPKSFISYYDEMQSLADLGFIVVEIDGMGTANRSKAFHDVCWHNLADGGFPDRILWMKALAARYPSADTTRVGLYGTSAGGQNALGALLFHPEWYKAGVASCGCHDNRIDKQWWNEEWMGYPVGPWYEEQSNVTNAYRLRGNLLLMVGEADENVPPESTYRVADALIKANKTFDFLPIPGSNHTDGNMYGTMKRRDFFVQHLLGVPPPERNSGELAGK